MSKKNKAKKTSPASAPQKKVDSRVEHPSYYNAHPSGVECIDIVRHYNFNVGNVIKYLWRHGLKREEGMNNKAKALEDLRKARFYLDDEIKSFFNASFICNIQTNWCHTKGFKWFHGIHTTGCSIDNMTFFSKLFSSLVADTR